MLAGLIQSVVKRPTRKGAMLARFEIADETGSREVVAFSRVFEEIAPKLVEDAPAVLVCEVSEDADAIRQVADRLNRWDERTLGSVPEVAVVRFDLDGVADHQCEDLRSRIDELSGNVPVELRVRAAEGIVRVAGEGARIDPDALPAIGDACPWLEATLTVDTRALMEAESRNGNGRGAFARRAPQAAAPATDVPF